LIASGVSWAYWKQKSTSIIWETHPKHKKVSFQTSTEVKQNQRNISVKKPQGGPGIGVQACNPSYSGGRDRRIKV
jgi:hypothetical protein